MSKIIGTLITMTFMNRTRAVDVAVAGMTKEFEKAGYEKFNKSLCQYMDSIEISMYIK